MPTSIELVTDGARARQPFRTGAHEIGAVSLTIADPEPLADGASATRWSIANRGDEPVRIRSVGIVFSLPRAPSAEPLRMLRHGYQSWSPCDVAIFGADADPSLTAGSIELVRAGAHADQRVVGPGELRSEWVTVLATGGTTLLAGFEGGSRHDGTLRLRPSPDPDRDGPELVAEAFLGDACLEPGTERVLHSVIVDDAAGRTPAARLESWAARVAAAGRARTSAPFQVGWCSWYHYFHDVTERDFRSNLILADSGSWPFDVLQLDDGYQRSIGDWLQTNEKFPSGLDEIAAAIDGSGRRAGIWIAPFLAAPDSEVATRHPDWLARLPSGDPLPGSFNPPWGGGLGGVMWTLDTTHPEVVEHLESVARQLVEAGFTYLKLDFTYAPSFDGRFHDASLTPAERVRAGFEAVRRGAGEDAFLLGCGVPLSNVVGVVDGARIGADVAPSWGCERTDAVMAGYLGMLPATRHAAMNTFARSFMHRSLWLNDPDCLMLRRTSTGMSADQIETWARIVAESGGMVLVSDDLALLDGDARRLLDEVVVAGRERDAEAASGRPPRCVDLMSAACQPGTLASAGGTVTSVDAETGRSRQYRSSDDE